ncbi:MAG: hypothetical protein B6D64_11065 [Bacteroidetes bacterium 4484_276]|nr:MAG: hypothetical protein B6D64_11065 [Bacteroidetes bacterium 4484_276]
MGASQLFSVPYALYAETAGDAAGWTVSGDDMYSGVSGNVGIGTSSPAARLAVKDASGGSFALTDGGGPGTNGAPSGMYPLRLYEDWGWNFTLQDETNSGFRVKSADGNTAFFNVEGVTGNVGIGTSSPSGFLDIYQEEGYLNETLDQQQILMLTGALIMKIYSEEGNNGTMIGMSDTVSRNNNGSGYVGFTFPNPIEVSGGQQYTFAVEIYGIRWSLGYNDANPYPGGSLSYAGQYFGDDDTRFKTYVATYHYPVSFIVKDNGNVGIATASPSNKLSVNGNADFTGNVGIGTTAPSQKLHIKGTTATDAVLFIQPGEWNSAGDYGEIRIGDANHYIRGEHSTGMSFYGTDKFSFNGGNVGIGTTRPSCPLEVFGYGNMTYNYGYLNSGGNTGTNSGTNHYSIRAAYRIVAEEFNAISDQRIKTDFNISNGKTDLETINLLEVTDYTYFDTLAKGSAVKKGFIAQQVEKVFP